MSTWMAKKIDAMFPDSTISKLARLTGYGRRVFLVYVLIDPRTNEVFYVGQTSDPEGRIGAHTWGSSNADNANRIKAIHRSRRKAIFRVVSKHSSRDAALAYEKRLIQLLAREPWRELLIIQRRDPFAGDYAPKITNRTHNPNRRQRT